jgi:hypothetical protein
MSLIDHPLSVQGAVDGDGSATDLLFLPKKKNEEW